MIWLNSQRLLNDHYGSRVLGCERTHKPGSFLSLHHLGFLCLTVWPILNWANSNDINSWSFHIWPASTQEIQQDVGHELIGANDSQLSPRAKFFCCQEFMKKRLLVEVWRGPRGSIFLQMQRCRAPCAGRFKPQPTQSHSAWIQASAAEEQLLDPRGSSNGLIDWSTDRLDCSECPRFTCSVIGASVVGEVAASVVRVPIASFSDAPGAIGWWLKISTTPRTWWSSGCKRAATASLCRWVAPLCWRRFRRVAVCVLFDHGWLRSMTSLVFCRSVFIFG